MWVIYTRFILNVLLASIFLVSSTGFTLSKHYCGGHLAFVELGEYTGACCLMESSHCCHNEHQKFQIEEDFLNCSIQLENKEFFTINTSSVLWKDYYNHSRVQRRQQKRTVFYADTSPPLSNRNVFAQMQIFLL